MMRKVIGILLVFALFLSTASNFAVADEAESLTFLDIATSDTRMAYFQAVFDSFYQETGIKVEYEGIGWNSANTKLITLASSGELPDVFSCPQAWETQFAGSDWLLNLDDYVSQHADEYVKIVTDYFWKVERQNFGHNYIIPDAFLVRGIFYRTDWVNEIGYQIPTGKDWTWDELWKLAEALTDTSKNRYGIAFRGGTGSYNQVHDVVHSYTNGYTWNMDTMQSTMNSQEAYNGFKAWTDCYLNGWSPADSLNWGFSELVDAFCGGLCGLFINDSEVSTSCSERMEGGTWGVLPMPYNEYGTRGCSLNSSYGYVVAANTKHADAAIALIDYLTDGARNAEYATLSGQVPVKKNAADSENFSEDGPMGAFITELDDPNLMIPVQGLAINESLYADVPYQSELEMQSYLLGQIDIWDWLNGVADAQTSALRNYMAENPDYKLDSPVFLADIQ